ncbi:TOMM precursor leader peptide-binding protein [Streptomyces sp. NPDC002588]|uniref:TOMM precursor leader peptide-binding protein n=1 Tax=Streptomyces sp. NPDC002588 TaxID=3154419 RepID=UPI003319A0AD
MSAGGTGLDRTEGDDSALLGFKRHLQATVVPGEAAYLVSQAGVTALHGAHAEVLVPLLDGTRSVRSVIEAAGDVLSADEVRGSLRLLQEAGLLRRAPAGRRQEAPSASDHAARAYWELAGLDGDGAAGRLATTSVRIMNLAAADTASLVRACADSGLQVTEEPGAGLTLVLCDDYLSPDLHEVNVRHRAQGQPWMLAKLSGSVPWVGPLFRPQDGPCWSCLAVRLNLHRRSESPLQLALGLRGPLPRPEASLPAGRSLAMHTAVLESAKWLAGIRCAGQDAVHTFDTVSLGVDSHPVARRPQCSHCGDPGLTAARVQAPFVPVSRPKAVQEGNGHRALTAQQMLRTYGHLIDPLTGIIKEVRRDPRSPDFVQTYLSGPNLATSAHTLAGLRAGLRTLSGGKGSTEAEARTSALCEAVERYCGTRHGDEPVVVGSYRSLRDQAVHPHALQLYDERQFRDRDRWNAARSPFTYVPPRFDEERVTEWTPTWSLTGGCRRLVPTSLLYYALRAGADDTLRADSNGNGAGSSPEDALVQGFLELVERDAVALWWYNRTRQPAVDLTSFADPCVDGLVEGCRRIGREVWALDLTSDFGIPVVVALSRRTDKPAEDIVFGFGAHFDPRVAVRRALTEMAQLLPAVCSVRPDGSGYGIDAPEPRRWWQHSTTANQPYLRPSRYESVRTPATWAYAPRTDLRDDVTAIVDLVRERGLELLVLDQTRPDIGLPVVKVIVPGMRHFWARFAPGRLFDVPVALGRVKEPTPYERLNPIPLFV